MNNFSDFANFGELQILFGVGAPGEGAGRGRQAEVCAQGAKDPCYASASGVPRGQSGLFAPGGTLRGRLKREKRKEEKRETKEKRNKEKRE